MIAEKITGYENLFLEKDGPILAKEKPTTSKEKASQITEDPRITITANRYYFIYVF